MKNIFILTALLLTGLIVHPAAGGAVLADQADFWAPYQGLLDRHLSSGVREGIELTLRELTHAFSKHGIEPVSPEVGELFDPQLHQAMFEAPVPSVEAGRVIQVMVEGFTIHDRLLRPAQVGVSSTPAQAAGGE